MSNVTDDMVERATLAYWRDDLPELEAECTKRNTTVVALYGPDIRRALEAAIDGDPWIFRSGYAPANVQ